MQENVEQKYDFDLEANLGSHVESKSKNQFPLCFIEHFKISVFVSLLPPAVRVEDWPRLLLHNELKDASALQSEGKMCGPCKVTCKFISV